MIQNFYDSGAEYFETKPLKKERLEELLEIIIMKIKEQDWIKSSLIE